VSNKWKEADTTWKKQQNILIKETYMLLQAVRYAPNFCNLRIYSDSQPAIAAVAKGICKNIVVSRITDKFWRQAERKHITPIVLYVKSKENPADAPSRRIDEESFTTEK